MFEHWKLGFPIGSVQPSHSINNEHSKSATTHFKKTHSLRFVVCRLASHSVAADADDSATVELSK